MKSPPAMSVETVPAVMEASVKKFTPIQDTNVFVLPDTPAIPAKA